LRVWQRRRSRLSLAVAFAFALLAEALVVAVASLATAWQLSWWEWHVLMAISFAAIGAASWSEWYEERFSALYLDETLAGRRDVTVLFADLAGFTPFSEAHRPEAVHRMWLTYFKELTPMISDEFGGEVQDFVGDQIFAIFNKRAISQTMCFRRPERRLSSKSAPKPSEPPIRLAPLPGRSQWGLCWPGSSAAAAIASTAYSATPSTSVPGSRRTLPPAAS
jgi:hypothetical protein